MARYDVIEGYIEDIYLGKTSNETEYLGIKFHSHEETEYPGFREIKWFFTPKAREMSQDKVLRVLKMAGLEPTGSKPTTPKTALKLLAREELVYLKIPITVQPNEYEGKVRSQFDLGWDNDGEPLGLVSSGFDKFGDLLAKRREQTESDSKPNADQSAKPEVTVFDDSTLDVYNDEIPF
ncbi:MAG: hypothetical protein FWD27_00630 [Coriobacteriia bacterium]|nr:hypothetical protein [Coriobacteriia bacterium]